MRLHDLEQFRDATVTVMGLGKYAHASGFVTATWLIRHGAQIVVTDLKTERDLEKSIELLMAWYREYRTQHPDAAVYPPVFALGEHRRDDFVSVDYVVQNPGVPSESTLVQAAEEAGVALESDASIFLRFFPYPTIAVTGTKGKTTTTKMIGEMLKTLHPQAIIAGNISASPLAFLDDALALRKEIPAVLEFSTWMLMQLPQALADLGRGPDIALLTNVSADHAARYPDYAAYKKSKEILFTYQRPDQIAILNKDHPEVREVASRVPSRVLWVSVLPIAEEGCYVEHDVIRVRFNGQVTDVLPLSEVAFMGEDRVLHALFATCAAFVRGVSREGIVSVLRTFLGSAGVQEVVREVDEITYVNDSASLTPEGMRAALAALGAKKRVVLIAGGSDTGASFAGIAPLIEEMCKQVIVLPGSGGEALTRALLGKFVVEPVKTLPDAVQYARSVAATGDVVLFSPGCSLAPLFASASDAGEVFREAVRMM